MIQEQGDVIGGREDLGDIYGCSDDEDETKTVRVARKSPDGEAVEFEDDEVEVRGKRPGGTE